MIFPTRQQAAYAAMDELLAVMDEDKFAPKDFDLSLYYNREHHDKERPEAELELHVTVSVNLHKDSSWAYGTVRTEKDIENA
jgi:hypothetical protein